MRRLQKTDVTLVEINACCERGKDVNVVVRGERIAKCTEEQNAALSIIMSVLEET